MQDKKEKNELRAQIEDLKKRVEYNERIKASTYRGFGRRTERNIRCYNCQELGHRAHECKKNNKFDRNYISLSIPNTSKQYKISANNDVTIHDIQSMFAQIADANQIKIQYSEDIEKCKIETIKDKIVEKKA